MTVKSLHLRECSMVLLLEKSASFFCSSKKSYKFTTTSDIDCMIVFCFFLFVFVALFGEMGFIGLNITG